MASAEPLQEFITCSICLEVFTNPTLLICRHVYCHDCIQQLKQGSQIQCPDCRETSSIHDLKKDFRTQSLVDEFNTQGPVAPHSLSAKLCDICNESGIVAKSFCKVCEEFLCKQCDRVQRRSKATKDHKLIEFIQMLKENQRDIESQIKKLQDKRHDVHGNISSVDSFTKELEESREQLIAEVNKYKIDILRKVEEHHEGLIKKINSTIESLHKTLKETKTLFEKCYSKLEDKVSFLSDISNSQNYSLIIETLANLREQIEKGLQEMDRELPKFDSRMKCPIAVLKGEDQGPENMTQIKFEHQTVEYITELEFHLVSHKLQLRNFIKLSACYYFLKVISALVNHILFISNTDTGVCPLNFESIGKC